MSMTLCPTDNPCNCLMPKASISTKKPSCPTGDCLVLCTGRLDCENAVGPCGQSGTFDFTTLTHNYDGCGTNPVRWSIEDYDREHFVSVSIDRLTGLITWVTQGADRVGKYGDICIKGECIEDCNDCGKLEYVTTFTIGVKDLCLVSDCEDCETCDPCTGNCIDNDTNLKTQMAMNNSNIQING